MPSLGADMEAGTLLEWRVKPGDRIKRGDIIAEVDTDKAAIEIEVFETGIVEEILVTPGVKVAVGTPLARIRADGEAPAPRAPERAPEGAVPSARHAASPLARKMARELGVDLASVTGTGPGGAVTREDVVSASGAPPADARRAAMRSRIGALMARSKREIPHYYLATTVDMRRATDWLDTWNSSHGVEERLLSAVMVIKAVALAVHDVPEMNGFFTDAFHASEGVHVGVAISLRDAGLIAPALHDVDKKSLLDLMRELKDLVTRARKGVLRASEMSDATITVTNLGDQGVDEVFGVIYPPQVALVGFGKVVERAWAVGGMIGAHPVARATLSADHRASDGHRGGLFLEAIDHLLQEPERL